VRDQAITGRQRVRQARVRQARRRVARYRRELGWQRAVLADYRIRSALHAAAAQELRRASPAPDRRRPSIFGATVTSERRAAGDPRAAPLCAPAGPRAGLPGSARRAGGLLLASDDDSTDPAPDTGASVQARELRTTRAELEDAQAQLDSLESQFERAGDAVARQRARARTWRRRALRAEQRNRALQRALAHAQQE
jgi:hypothetical protein